MRNLKNGTQNALIHRKLSEILIRECNDPRFKRVTISRVEAVRGLSMAQIYFSVYPPEQIEELTISLNHAAGFFQQHSGPCLENEKHPTPEVHL